MSWIAAVLACQLAWIPCVAQRALMDASAVEYQAAIHTVKLVRNKQTILPLENIGGQQISTFFSGTMYGDVLSSLTDTYCQATHATEVQDVPEDCTLLIFGLGLETDLTNDDVRALVEERHAIAILFDEKIYNKLPDIVRADAIVHAFGDNPLSAEIAVQQIFGGARFAEASAMVGDIRRLGFAPASMVGMDPVLLSGKIDSVMAIGLSQHAFPGGQVLVARRGKVIFHEVYGYHSYDSIQATAPDDIYDLASITKVAAATAAVMRLYDDGRFNLDATVADYYPDFANTDKANLRWRDILAHQARLKPWIPYWESTVKKNGKFKWGTFKHRPSRRFPIQVTDSLFIHKNYRKKIMRAIAKSPLNADSGFVYSGLSFYILPEIVERLSGVKFETLLRKDIYEPIGATTMGYHPLERFDRDRIVPTERDTFFRMTQLHGYVHDEGSAMMGGISGNAGLFSSAIDLAKFAQMLLDKGEYGGARIYSEETVAEFTRCQFCASGNHRGLGFDKPPINTEEPSLSIGKDASSSSYGHSGYTGTLMWIDPAEDLIYIFLSNRVYPTRLNRKLYTLNIRPDVHQALYDAIVE